MSTPWTGPCRLYQSAWPNWERLQADHDTFVAVLVQLFRVRGLGVVDVRAFREPGDSQARECGLLLEQGRERWAALGLRWTLPVTSDVIGRFARSLGPLHGGRGLVITTGLYTVAARKLARQWDLQLYDGAALKRWIASVGLRQWIASVWR